MNSKYIVQDELSIERALEYINAFQLNDLPRLRKLKNYYIGKQKILSKKSPNEAREFIPSVTNFCQYITDSYNGFIIGDGVSYSGDNFERIDDVLNYNDYVKDDSTFLKDALINGISYRMFYMDELGEIRFKSMDPRTIIPVYSADVNEDLRYVIRFYENTYTPLEKEWFIEIYSDTDVRIYKSYDGYVSATPLTEYPHYFKTVPFSVFNLNDDNQGIFEQVIGLQDTYNEIQSNATFNNSVFADAYLTLTGVTADEEDILAMQKNRVLMLPEGATANYLVKDETQGKTEELLALVKENIYKISGCPDFQSKDLVAQSGVAIRYKLIGFMNKGRNIENNFREALQRCIEIICNILNLTDAEYIWRDVNISFNENLPEDIESTAQIINQLRGVVSTRTLISQLSFIKNPDKELEQLAEENAISELYNFEYMLDSEGK